MTAFTLKIIALICMVIDHLGAVFPEYFPVAFRVIGRISFPIYVYLIANGCRHTRNMPKYLLRLGLFALISQAPFDLAFSQSYWGPVQVSFLHGTNVFYTLFLGALSIYCFQILRKSVQTWGTALFVPVLAVIMWLAEWLGTDYGGYGVIFVALMYLIPSKVPQLVTMAVCCCLQFYGSYILIGFAMLPSILDLVMTASCLISVVLAAFYNGRRGPGLKWFFYAAYPAHLLVLGCVWMVLKPGLPR